MTVWVPLLLPVPPLNAALIRIWIMKASFASILGNASW